MLNNTKVFPALFPRLNNLFHSTVNSGSEVSSIAGISGFLKRRFQDFSDPSILTVSLNASISLGAQDSF